MVGRIYSRGFPIGEVLNVTIGLEKDRLAALPKDFDKEYFRQWLMNTDKKVVTVSRLRVPNLRPERPSLDGEDLFDGFFAPAPAFWDVSAPLEGSIPMLKRQGFTFEEDELKAFDAMLRRSLGSSESGEFQWYSLPVGSRIAIISGKSPSIEVWINRGKQYPSVDQTIVEAQLEKMPPVSITDPLEVRAMNKHYNYSMIVEDPEVKKNTKGKYVRVGDRLHDIIKDKRYDPDDRL